MTDGAIEELFSAEGTWIAPLLVLVAYVVTRSPSAKA